MELKKIRNIKKYIGGLLGAACLVTANNALAADSISFGLQGGLNSSGPSLRYPVSETFTVQGIIGALGTVTSVSGRGLLYFRQTEELDWYYFGGLQFINVDTGVFGSENAFGISGGVGLDFDIRDAIAEAPPLVLSGEVGASFASFDNFNGFNLFNIGIGIHYLFE